MLLIMWWFDLFRMGRTVWSVRNVVTVVMLMGVTMPQGNAAVLQAGQVSSICAFITQQTPVHQSHRFRFRKLPTSFSSLLLPAPLRATFFPSPLIHSSLFSPPTLPYCAIFYHGTSTVRAAYWSCCVLRRPFKFAASLLSYLSWVCSKPMLIT